MLFFRGTRNPFRLRLAHLWLVESEFVIFWTVRTSHLEEDRYPGLNSSCPQLNLEGFVSREEDIIKSPSLSH